MKMVIGGAFQGKTQFAKTLCLSEHVIDGATCELEKIYEASMIIHFHEYIKRLLKENVDVLELPKKLQKLNPTIVIVSNELGYGIVPIDAFDRNYREQTGRVCCMLAEQSSEVYRVVCGLPQKIKG